MMAHDLQPGRILPPFEDFLSYDPIAGKLTWKRTIACVAAGKTAGKKTKTGYRVIRLDNCLYSEHRVIWYLQTGKWPLRLIDHINRIKDDNRWENLREATNGQNNANRQIQSNNTSGLKGVCWHKATAKWTAKIRHEGATKHLGVFSNIEDAANAYRKAAQSLQGEFYSPGDLVKDMIGKGA